MENEACDNKVYTIRELPSGDSNNTFFGCSETSDKDQLSEETKVTGIRVWVNRQLVTTIQFIYDHDTDLSKIHGFQRGNCISNQFSEDECIHKLSWTCTENSNDRDVTYIWNFKVTTNKNTYVYGGEPEMQQCTNRTEYEFVAEEGYEIVGIRCIARPKCRLFFDTQPMNPDKYQDYIPTTISSISHVIEKLSMDINAMKECLDYAGDVQEVFTNEIIQVLKYIDGNTGSVFYRGDGKEKKIIGASSNDSDYISFRKQAIHYTGYILKTSGHADVSSVVKDLDVQDIINCLSEKNSEGNLVFLSFYEKVAATGYYAAGMDKFLDDPTFEKVICMRIIFDNLKHDIQKIWRLKVLLLLMYLKDQSLYTRVSKKWQQFDPEFFIRYNLEEYFKKYDWSILFVRDLLPNKTIFLAMNQQVKAASERFRVVHHDPYQVFAAGEVITKSAYDEAIYGEEAIAWLKRVDLYKERSSGCMLTGTWIQLYDGTQKRVEEIAYKDELRNVQQGKSFVSKEHIENNKVDYLYAINDDEPFMSLDHAIMTDRGWCAPNPEVANNACPEFEVKKLQIGDKITKMDAQGNFHTIEVKKIHIIENKNRRICHDLHVYDGYHSYYANGYPCLLVYPQVSVSYIKDKLLSMPKLQRKKLYAQLLENQELLRCLFDETIMNHLQKMLLESED